MLRSTAITKELAVIERKLSETSNQVLKDALKKKQARLKDELKDAQKSTPQLAKKLLAQRAQIKALSKVDFNDLIRRLSKKPEYSFLKTMSKSTVKTDLERRAKPVGWRFKGRGNYDKPTMKEIVAGKKNKTVYREVRPRRSDVNLAVRLENGGWVQKPIKIKKDVYKFEDHQGVGYIVKRGVGERVTPMWIVSNHEDGTWDGSHNPFYTKKDAERYIESFFARGGTIGDSGTITDSKSMYQGKMGFIEMDMGNEWIVKVLINGKEKSVTVRKSGFKILKDDKMENGGVIGQEIVFDDSGEQNTGVIKDIHEITGNYVVLTDDGRTVLADKELDVISLGKMRTKPEAKKRFSFFEDGGNVAKETNEMLMSQIKEVKHHADELSQVVNKNTTIEPWVLAKATRAKTDLSDITHYLDGRKMARGGKLNDAQQEKFNKVMREWKAGTLHSGKNGPVVKDQDQAIAIAYAQANSMMAFGGMIYDDLSEGNIDRMEGLSPTATLDEFIMNTQYIVKSLEEEGFEKDEILSFLAHVMVTNISEAQSSSPTWTQQDQDALEGWISDIQDGYGWITPGYVETSWTSRPGSGTKEWTSDIQRRVYQALIDENMLFRANENDPEKKGKKVKDLTTAMWAASEEMSNGGSIDSQYWADYNDAPGPKYMSEKSKTFDTTFAKAVKEWNDMNDDGETLSKNNIERSRKVAKQFFDKEGYITINIVMAMISQESLSTGGKMATGGGVPIYEETDVEDLRMLLAENYDYEVEGDGHDVAKAFNRYRRGSKAKYNPSTDTITYIIDFEDKMATGGSMSGWKHKGKC
jgi:hypothetical protein